MRPADDDPAAQAGVSFQPVRGALCGLIFYLLRDVLFAPRGWWVTWLTLPVIGIAALFGAAPGSIEGSSVRPRAFGGLWAAWPR